MLLVSFKNSIEGDNSNVEQSGQMGEGMLIHYGACSIQGPRENICLQFFQTNKKEKKKFNQIN